MNNTVVDHCLSICLSLGLQSLITPSGVDHCLSICLSLGLQSLITPSVVDHCLSICLSLGLQSLHYPFSRQPLLVYLSGLRITVSHNPFGIFKLFLVMIYILKTCVYFSCNFRACDCWMQNWMAPARYILLLFQYGFQRLGNIVGKFIE